MVGKQLSNHLFFSLEEVMVLQIDPFPQKISV